MKIWRNVKASALSGGWRLVAGAWATERLAKSAMAINMAAKMAMKMSANVINNNG